jgi:hypothetical protein
MSFFKKLGDAIEGAAKTVEKDIDKSLHYSVAETIQPGNVVKLQSKTNGKYLRIYENGAVDCTGTQGSICEFIVEASPAGFGKFKFNNASQPGWYLGIVQNGDQIFLIGNASSGPESDFTQLVQGVYMALESTSIPQAHIGTLPSGQMTAPGQTPANNDCALFKPIYLRKFQPPQNLPPAQQPPPAAQPPPGGQPPPYQPPPTKS